MDCSDHTTLSCATRQRRFASYFRPSTFMSGPLTIGEMATRFGRSQSVVSEIVTGLERKRLLERMRDERDRRRTLVWLTDHARAVLASRRQVLDVERVVQAMKRMGEAERRALVQGMRALVHAAKAGSGKRSFHERREER